MTSRALKILQEALALPEDERALLIAELRRGPMDSPEEVEQAWHDEIVNRLKSLKDGTAVLHDWADVERELDEIVRGG
jgi:hypothetical protein